MHSNLRCSAFDFAKIVGRKFECGRSNVLFQAMQLRGARDGYDPRFLSKQPGQSDLGGRRLFLLRKPEPPQPACCIGRTYQRPSSLIRPSSWPLNDLTERPPISRSCSQASRFSHPGSALPRPKTRSLRSAGKREEMASTSSPQSSLNRWRRASSFLTNRRQHPGTEVPHHSGHPAAAGNRRRAPEFADPLRENG